MNPISKAYSFEIYLFNTYYAASTVESLSKYCNILLLTLFRTLGGRYN
jgi:hypothetical protein